MTLKAFPQLYHSNHIVTAQIQMSSQKQSPVYNTPETLLQSGNTTL